MAKLFINGAYVEGKGKEIKVINPADNTVVDTFFSATKEQAEETLQAAKKASAAWGKTPVMVRCSMLSKFADLVQEHRDELSQLNSLETGKPYGEAYGDTDFGLTVLRFHVEEAKRVYGTTLADYNGERGSVYHIVEKRPVGVVIGHLAWNYPMYNAALKIGPAIGSGCTLILKPSSQTPLATLLLGKLVKEAGIPDGVINIVAGTSSELGYALNSSDIPRLVTLIGSTNTALQIIKDGATSVKRYSFELGGNAATIVTPSADLELAATAIASLKMSNSGQCCVDHNRIFIHESIYDKVCDMIADKVRQYGIGKGNDEGMIIGPMINKAAQESMVSLVADAVVKGAKLMVGGAIPEGIPEGSTYFNPTVLKDCDKSMEVYAHEIFGPIVALSKYSDYDAVLEEAADTIGGLSSYLYSYNTKEIAKAVEGFNSGEVLVNVDGIGDVQFLPHCGNGNSGLGCDNSLWSLDEYFDLKRVKIVP